MKWFSISGIFEELKRVRWPKFGELMKSTGVVLLFTGAFALFFILCDLVAAGFIKFLGM